jgi:hypothetical protein
MTKSIFEPEAKQEIFNRIEKLTPGSERLWGKMTVSQMLAHCANAMGLAMGKIKPKKQFIGIIGWIFRSSYSNEKNFPKNFKTIKGGDVIDEKDFEAEKKRLMAEIEEMHGGGEKVCTDHPHPIMGKFNPDEWGKGMYKHLDHHLRQFGV